MTLDDLRQPWQNENAVALSPERREDAVLRVCRRVETFKAAILRRDSIEILAALFVIVCFGWKVLALPSIVAKVGAVIAVVAAIFIIYKLQRARRTGKSRSLDLSVVEYLEQEVAGVERQIDLLQTVAWWYIVPLLTAAAMVFCGMSRSLVHSAVYVVSIILFGWFVYWLNQRAVRVGLIPLRNELRGMLDECDGRGDEP